jgi:hypothetical protein
VLAGRDAQREVAHERLARAGDGDVDVREREVARGCGCGQRRERVQRGEERVQARGEPREREQVLVRVHEPPARVREGEQQPARGDVACARVRPRRVI